MTSQKQYNEVVQRLIKPVKPGEEWNINLTEDLRRYQECIVNCDFDNSIGEDNSIDCRPKATFIEGGLVIENASNTYSLRVDSAYETLINCNESLRKTLLSISTKDFKSKLNQVKESTKNATKTNGIFKTKQSNKQIKQKKNIKQKETNINKEHSFLYKFELKQDLEVKKDKNKRKVSDTNYYKRSYHIPIFLLQKGKRNTKDTVSEIFTNNSYDAVQHKFDFLVYSNLTNKYEDDESDDDTENDDNDIDVGSYHDTDMYSSEETFETNSENDSEISCNADESVTSSTFSSADDIIVPLDIAETCQEELLLVESHDFYLSDSVTDNFDKQTPDSSTDSCIRLSGSCSDDSGFGSSPEMLTNKEESDVLHCYYKDIISNECSNSLLCNILKSSRDENRDIPKNISNSVLNYMKKIDFLKLPEKYLKRKIIFDLLAELKKLKGGRIKTTKFRTKNQEKKIKQAGVNLLKDSKKSNRHPKSTDIFHNQIDANRDIRNKTVTDNIHIANVSSHEIPEYSQLCSMNKFSSFVPAFYSTPASNNYTDNQNVSSTSLCESTPPRYDERLLTNDSGLDDSYIDKTHDCIESSADFIPNKESSLSNDDDDLDESLEDLDNLDLIPPTSVENTNDQSFLQPNATDITSEYLINNSEPESNSRWKSTKHLSLTEKYQFHDKDMEERVHVWQQSVKPQFNLDGNRSDLSLQHYEEIVLEKLRSAKNNRCNFGHILGRQNKGQVGRYLLAILMLTNKGKVLVSQDRSMNDFRPSSICVELRNKQIINGQYYKVNLEKTNKSCNKNIRKQIPKL